MEGHDFDKLFGSKLPDLADKNWSKLETKLEKFNLERKLAKLIWALWGLGGLSGLLLGITGILYYQSSLHEEQLSSLKRNIALSNHQSYLKADTIYRKIILYDTVYQTVSIQSKKVAKEQAFADVTTGKYKETISADPDLESTTARNTEFQQTKDLAALNGKEAFFNPIQANLSPFEFHNEVDSSETTTTFSLKPASVNIGFIAGYGQLFGELFGFGNGLQAGVRTQLGYNNRSGKERWGVILDVQRSIFSFDPRGNGRLKNRVPNNLPNITDPRLNEAHVQALAAYQVGIGFRYNLLFSSKVKPYLGINWAIQLPSYYTVHYSLDASGNQVSEDYDKTYNTNLAAIPNILGANVGLNYQLSPRLSTGLEVYFQSQLAREATTPDVLGGRLGLHYRLGTVN